MNHILLLTLTLSLGQHKHTAVRVLYTCTCILGGGPGSINSWVPFFFQDFFTLSESLSTLEEFAMYIGGRCTGISFSNPHTLLPQPTLPPHSSSHNPRRSPPNQNANMSTLKYCIVPHGRGTNFSQNCAAMHYSALL